ncbi:MAG: sulfide/dihydroorotate dehydrogenase-like FAD/NAD-binding protein [Candidatus Omnitrophota bacterium]|nr:sulfide/dihydroorotate dehydrogenase-like FAD/NAD-binding protein [Candidatus Omnitrophota bacterium]
MYRILKKEDLNPSVCYLEISSPQIAKAAQPGQFIILRITEKGERIPLTIHGFDEPEDTISIIVQKAGKTTDQLCSLNAGDGLLDLAGPLGKPSLAVKEKRVLFIAGGVGAAEAYPIARAIKQERGEVAVILGAKSAEDLILEKQLRALTSKVYVSTDDGSYGRKGFVTDLLSEILLKDKSFDLIYAIGPLAMMAAVSNLSRHYKVKTLVSLNSIMLDGTGMCGSCRVTVGNETKFACVDGPEFDGHLVDFDELMKRQARFKKKECRSRKLAGKK